MRLREDLVGHFSYRYRLACTSVPWEAGDILNTSLRKIWESSPVLEEIRNLTLKDYDVCKSAHWSRRAPEETERPMWKAVHTRELTNMPGS